MTSLELEDYLKRLSPLLGDKELSELTEVEFKGVLDELPLPLVLGLSINAAFYRAVRPWPGMKTGLIQSFTHRKPDECDSTGRCHLPKHPVFYAADSIDTAIKEVFQSVDSSVDGEIVYVSKWRPCIPLNYIQFLLPGGFLKSEVSEALNRHVLELHRSSMRMYPKEAAQKFELVAQRIGQGFMVDDHSRSSRLSHAILYAHRPKLPKENPLHAILYPSVVKEHSGLCAAIHPAVVKQQMMPEGVWKFQVVRNSSNGVVHRYAGYGMVRKGGHIQWYDIGPSVRSTRVITVAVASRGAIPVEVAPETLVTINGRQETVLEHVTNYQWPSITKDLQDLGETVEDIGPGTILTRRCTIPLVPQTVATAGGEVLAVALLVFLSIPFDFLPSQTQ